MSLPAFRPSRWRVDVALSDGHVRDVAKRLSQSWPARPVVLAAVVLGATGCSQPPTLNKAAVTQSLRGYLTTSCDPETVSIRAARLGTPAVLADETAFARAVISNPDFNNAANQSLPFKKSGRLTFVENDQELHAEWSEFAPLEAAVRDSLTVRGCLYVPDRIDLIDDSVDDRANRVRVVFRETLRLSRIGKSLSTLGMLDGYQVFNSHHGFVAVAHLRAVGDGTWRVDRVHQI